MPQKEKLGLEYYKLVAKDLELENKNLAGQCLKLKKAMRSVLAENSELKRQNKRLAQAHEK